MKVLGIDPGKTGAFALIDGEKLIEIVDMPTISVVVSSKNRDHVSPAQVARILVEWRPDRIILEKVWARPLNGAAHAFSFGRSYGVVEGVVAALKIPCEYVVPATWKRALNTPADKGGARAQAMALFPDYADRFKRVKDDGRAEASLIALYGSRMKWNG